MKTSVANVLSQVADSIMGEKKTDSPTKPLLSTTKKMRALVWNGLNDVQYTETAAPILSDSRDIILRVTASSICGSDIHLVDGSMPDMRSGDILGHEFLGIVEEVGLDVRTIKKGQRVIVAFCIACGDCAFCNRKEYSACKNTNSSNLIAAMYGHRTSAIYGYSHLLGGIPGGQAEFVRVAFADFNCLIVPDEVSDEKALLLTDVLPTSYHGAKLAKIQKGDVVGVWGMGPIGLFVAKWCQMRGAGRVVGIDCVPERLRKARELAIDTINYKEHDVVSTFKELFPDGIDAAIECVGGEYSKSIVHRVERALNLESDSSDIFSEMFQSVRPFGRVTVIGVYVGYANHFPVGAMMEKAITVNGGQAPVQRYWKKLMKMVQEGVIDPSFLITHRCDLSKGPEVYKQFMERKEGILKVVMRPEGMTRGRAIE